MKKINVKLNGSTIIREARIVNENYGEGLLEIQLLNVAQAGSYLVIREEEIVKEKSTIEKVADILKESALDFGIDDCGDGAYITIIDCDKTIILWEDLENGKIDCHTEKKGDECFFDGQIKRNIREIKSVKSICKYIETHTGENIL